MYSKTANNTILLAFLVLGVIARHGHAWPVATGDADRDGWYDGKKNLRATLALTGMTSNKAGDYYVTVDDVHFPHAQKNLQV